MTRGTRSDLDSVVAATVAAVSPEELVPRRLQCRGGELLLDATPCAAAVRPAGRIVVVGGGKAAAGVAAAVETMLLSAGVRAAAVSGLVSVPAGCGRRLDRVEVRETRPAGTNLPTAAAVTATREMLAVVAGLGPDDLAIVAVTGGGSAALEDPIDGVSLADLISVTRTIAAAGGDIRELNLVRQALSRVKAGGLARGCRAGRLLALVLSDVIGDPLDLIASGPCMPVVADPTAARAILARRATDVPQSVIHALGRSVAGDAARPGVRPGSGDWTTPAGCHVSHVVLGSNATAVDAAACAAGGLGYDVTVRHPDAVVESADSVGLRLAREAIDLVALVHRDGRPRALIEGGEAVVRLPGDHGHGGRNQQTTVAAIEALRRDGRGWPAGVVVASLGTDGEDGPTTAAGGFADAEVVSRIEAAGVDIPRTVSRCDAYPALNAGGGLIRTGPTGTNAADVRIVLARA